jgi:hypothetical protein
LSSFFLYLFSVPLLPSSFQHGEVGTELLCTGRTAVVEGGLGAAALAWVWFLLSLISADLAMWFGWDDGFLVMVRN